MRRLQESLRLLAVLLAALAALSGRLDAENPTADEEALAAESDRLWNSAQTAHRENRLPEADQAFRACLAACQRQFPPATHPRGHHNIAECMNQLAIVASDSGRHADAVQWHEKALEAFRKLYPPDEHPRGHPQIARALSNLAQASMHARNHQRARELSEAALKMRRELYSIGEYPNGDEDLLNSLVATASIRQDFHEFDLARARLEEALAICRKLFPPDKFPEGHNKYASVLNNLAWLCSELGDRDQALRYQSSALSMRRRLFTPQKYPRGAIELAVSMANMATMLAYDGRFTEAIELARETVEMYQRLYPQTEFPSGHPALANAWMNLGAIRMELAQSAEASRDLEKADAMYAALIARDSAMGLYVGRAETQLNLAEAHQARNDSWKQRQCLEQALSLYERIDLAGEAHVVLADWARTLSELGLLLDDQGEKTEAFRRHRQALEVRRRLYPPEQFKLGHRQLVISLINHGVALADGGATDEAIAAIEEALGMCRKLYPLDKYPLGHEDIVSCLDHLSRLYGQHRDHEAELLNSRRALAMSRRLHPEGNGDTARQLNNLGMLLCKRGLRSEGLPLLQESNELRRKQFPASRFPFGHPEIATALGNLGSQQHAEGELELAADCLLSAVNMRQRLAAEFLKDASEATALNFMAAQPHERDGLISVWLEAGRDAEELYECLWNGRNPIFEMLAERQRRWVGQPSAQESAALQQLTSIRRKLADAALSNTAASPEQEAELGRLSATKERLERELALSGGSATVVSRRPTPAELTAALPPNSALIDIWRFGYYVPADARVGREIEVTHSYVAFVVAPGEEVKLVDLGPAKGIDDAARAWRDAIVANAPDEWELGRTLRSRLWRPIVEALPNGIATAWVIPDGPLTALPWIALPGREANTRLLEELAIAVTPHGPFLLRELAEPSRTTPETEVLAVGDVAYDLAPRTESQPGGLAALSRAAIHVSGHRRWQDLPGTKVEVEQIAALAEGRRVHRLTGAAADVAAVYSALPRVQHALLATHGFFTPVARSGKERVSAQSRNPLLCSGMVLAGANLPQGEAAFPVPGQSLLTAEAIAGLDLSRLEIAVLSACESGLGEIASNEGVFGLQRAFHQAGTRNVVASLWSVDDAATLALMTRFHRNLWQHRLSPLEALREAQLAMLRDYDPATQTLSRGQGELVPFDSTKARATSKGSAKQRTPPKYWAAFMLSGCGIDGTNRN